MINKNKHSMEEIEKIIANGVASLSFENLICTPEDIESARRVLLGQVDIEEEINSIIKQYAR